MSLDQRHTWTAGQASWAVIQIANRIRDLRGWLRFRSVCEASVSYRSAPISDPLIDVSKNLLTRGWPTAVSQATDDRLAECLGITFLDPEKPTETGHVFLESNDQKVATGIRYALSQLDCRPGSVDGDSGSVAPYDSRAEERLGEKLLPSVCGGWTRVAFRRQGRFSQILPGFEGQEADFVLALPPRKEGGAPRLWVIEVDGPEHLKAGQQALDQRRDRAIAGLGGGTIRLPLTETEEGIDGFDEAELRRRLEQGGFFRLLEEDRYLAPLMKTWREPMWSQPASRKWLELVNTPFAVARVQRAMLHAIENGVLSLQSSSWSIAVHERDVPCGQLAIEDTLSLLRRLIVLSGSRETIPEIDLIVRSNPEFCVSTLHASEPTCSWPNDRRIDLLIDVSVLQYFGQTSPGPDDLQVLGGPEVVVIRNSEVPLIQPGDIESLSISSPLEWRPEHPGAEECCEQFLQDIFRKKTFREGQWEIISRALCRHNAVGVLPTGSGKSICYQMSSLLQPGITLVVPPLVALAADQIRGIQDAGIQRCCSLSSLSPTERGRRMRESISERKNQFVFVTPERFQMDEFRAILAGSRFNGLCPVQTVVLDEVHCVSQWGHDFRPSYLSLGETARRYLDAESTRILGLTGTASFDVLSDAAREVGGLKENDLIEADQYDREELNLRVVPTAAYLDGKRLIYDKVPTLKKVLIEDIPSFFGMSAKEFYSAENGRFTRAGIVFCPHAKIDADGSKFSVGKVSAEITQILIKAGINIPVESFSGVKSDSEKERIQQGFLADRLPILVSTIAFGMGIDKPNIRFVIHYAGAKSIEAYYQEIGRAGRDRKPAYCVTLLSDSGADEGDELDKWLESRDPHLTSPKTGWDEQDDRDVQKFFQDSNFPPAKQTKRIIWELAKLIEQGKPDQRIKVGFDWVGTLLWQRGELSSKIDVTGSWIQRELCRLSYLGLVRDYTVDFNKRCLLIERGSFDHANVSKRFLEYVERYKSPAYARRDLDAMLKKYEERRRTHPHLGLWVFATGSMVEFAYNEISIKRRGALREYIRVMRLGVKNEQALREEVGFYFNSKYYRELQKHSKGCDISVLWDYLEREDSNLDDLRQLHGGVVRHLANNADHVVFRLIRAFCLLSHGNFSPEEATQYLEAFDDAIQDMDLGSPDRKQVGAWISRFQSLVIRRTGKESPVLSDWIANHHLAWVDQFHKHFMENE